MARVITSGAAVARGVGGRRGRAARRAWLRLCGASAEMRSTDREERRALEVREDMRAIDPGLGPLGKQECRRRAKLRRRARDREVVILTQFLPIEDRWRASPWRRMGVMGWWSTPEGRRRWVEDDRARKRARRATTRCLRETLGCGPMSPRTADAADNFERVLGAT